MSEEKDDDIIAINMKDMREVIDKSDLPLELKKRLNESLPELLENVGDAAKVVYDPNSIWLEALQFADYAEQHFEHIGKCPDDSCAHDSLEVAIAMTRSFKQMAEHAMRVLDTLKIESDLIDWNTVKVTYSKDDDAQQ